MQKKIAIFIIGFLVAGFLIDFSFPKERKMNAEAEIRVGAGDDVSGLLMQETMQLLEGKYALEDDLEGSSFQDC